MGYAFENYYNDTFEGHDVVIFLGRDLDLDILNKTGEVVPGKILDAQMYVTLTVNGKVVREDDDLYGELIVGENLRDMIGYGPAKDMLARMKIPENSLIWKLGRKG